MSEETKIKPKQIKIKVEVDENLSGGTYCNLILVNHSDSEFVLDGFFLQPQKPAAKHGARLVLSPRSAKRLHQLLGNHLTKFEQLFGEIKLAGPKPPETFN